MGDYRSTGVGAQRDVLAAYARPFALRFLPRAPLAPARSAETISHQVFELAPRASAAASPALPALRHALIPFRY